MRYLVHHLLRDAAAAHPDRSALADGDRLLTYQELDDLSSRLAATLVDAGVRRGDRVGLYLDKSAESVIAVYAALKAGAAYVPLDPDAPPARLAHIIGNCSIEALATGAEKATVWPEVVRSCPLLRTLVVLNADDAPRPDPRIALVGERRWRSSTPLAADVPAIEQDLAYLLYTSGSTGDPKGVMLTHRNALTFVLWAAERFGVGPEDRLSSHAPLHFDLSTFDLFAAAAGAATVVLAPSSSSIFPVQVARFIEGNGITVWYSVPSILSMLVSRGGLHEGAFPNLRTVLFAGEVFPTKYLRRLMELMPHAGFFNLYGPTETNVCTYYEVPTLDPDEAAAIPIGRAIDDVDVFAVTHEGGIAAPGEVGELYVRGPSVMRGYWGDPERTNRMLVPDPTGGEVRDLVYRTGDLVVEEADGNYRLLGRRDSQIKSRGYRIELGDVEAALYAHPDVLECAVVAVPDEMVTNRLHAFVVVRGDGLNASDLAAFCAERIPRYMIPERFDFRDRLPKTSTGKVDRRSLEPAPAP